MLNLDYKNWLVPYVEGTLDARRKAILESRLKTDNNLAAEVDSLRNVSQHLHASAGADQAYYDERAVFVTSQRSVWPRVEAVIAERKGGVVYSPRFALAGGLAVVAIVAVTWIGGGLNQKPASNTVALSSSKGSTNTPAPHGNVTTPPVAPPVHRSPALTANNTQPSAPPVVARHDDSPQPAFATAVAHHPRVDIVSDPDGNDLHSPFAENSDNVMPSPSRATNAATPPAPPDQSKPAAPVTMATAYHVDSNDALTTWTVTNGAMLNATTRPGDALLGINIPRVISGRGNKAVPVSGAFMSVPAVDVNFSSHADDSLSRLRDISVDLITHVQPSTVHEALNSWRDTLMVDLNTTVDQNSTTSSQADETLGLLRGTGHLTDFYALMRDECQSRPQEVASWRVLAHVNSALGSTAEAVNAWVEVTKSSTASAEDWYQLGVALEANNNPAGAIAAYNQVIELGEASRTADAQSHLAALGH